jgi:eukaryotic-like serine/threonine-protein kinase
LSQLVNNTSTFFQQKPLVKHFLLFASFLLLMLLLIYVWLRFYTNHGQKIPMVNITGKTLKEASNIISKNSFQLIVIDSVFMVGKQGGLILDQNPKPNAEVKEGRKIYISITKHDPDKILVSELPLLYGNDFVQKSIELKQRGIMTSIKAKKYDSGDPNHILEVYYNDQLIIDNNVIRKDVKIDKGSTLEFVVSDKAGGEINIPDLICSSVAEIEFLLQESNLEIGEITTKGNIPDTAAAFILDQDPKFDGISKIPMKSKINLTIIANKPTKCN